MNCYQCGRPGKCQGLWWSPKKRNKFTAYICTNPACRFTYTRATMGDGHDGKTATAYPTWMAPSREVA